MPALHAGIDIAAKSERKAVSRRKTSGAAVLADALVPGADVEKRSSRWANRAVVSSTAPVASTALSWSSRKPVTTGSAAARSAVLSDRSSDRTASCGALAARVSEPVRRRTSFRISVLSIDAPPGSCVDGGSQRSSGRLCAAPAARRGIAAPVAGFGRASEILWRQEAEHCASAFRWPVGTFGDSDPVKRCCPADYVAIARPNSEASRADLADHGSGRRAPVRLKATIDGARRREDANIAGQCGREVGAERDVEGAPIFGHAGLRKRLHVGEAEPNRHSVERTGHKRRLRRRSSGGGVRPAG